MKADETSVSRSPQAGGFARPDLIIVTAIVVLVGVAQLPLLARSHAGDLAARCRNNLRQLGQAWLMYSDDNRGFLPPNYGDVASGGSPIQQSWAPGWLDYTSSFDNINTDLLVDFQKTGNYGHLGPYVKSPLVFKCPEDTSQVTIFGRRQSRVRSVSMNNWVGGSAFAVETEFRVFHNESEIIGLPPSMAWVIQDEREDSINDSIFQVDMLENLASFPASYHNGGGNLAYADGHVGYHQWQDKRTNPELIKGNLLNLNVPSPNNADLDWLRARTTIVN